MSAGLQVNVYDFYPFFKLNVLLSAAILLFAVPTSLLIVDCAGELISFSGLANDAKTTSVTTTMNISPFITFPSWLELIHVFRFNMSIILPTL